MLKVDHEIMRKEGQENIGLLQILHPTFRIAQIATNFYDATTRFGPYSK
jgi:hypothetical protein